MGEEVGAVFIVLAAVCIVGIATYLYNDSISYESVYARCAEEKRIVENRKKFEAMFLQCLNTPRRVATGTDDESDIVSECIRAAASAYPISPTVVLSNKEYAKFNEICNIKD